MQKYVKEVFENAFGRTSLRERLEDIFDEAVELRRFTDMTNLREEAGDLMASTLQLCNECGWVSDELVRETLVKIKKREEQYKSLGRKKVVALMGGAFDPPTKGHIEVAKFVLKTSKVFDEVWLVPCFSHMYNKKMTDFGYRLEMCRLASQSDGRILVSDYEIKNRLKGDALNFIKRIQNEDFAKNKYEFSYIIGLDNANTFHQWVGYKDLENLIRFIVVPRKGILRDTSVNWYFQTPHIFLCGENDIPETSSTQARRLLGLHGPDPEKVPIVPEIVLKYIRDNNLYPESNIGE